MSALTSNKFYEIQENVEKTTEEIRLRLDKIVKRPFYKKLYYKVFPTSEIKEFQIAFDYLTNKKNELIQSRILINKLYDNLIKENEELIKEIKRFDKEKDIENATQLRMKFTTNQEMIVNQIPIVIDMIDTFIGKLEKALPHMESTIKKRLIVNTTLKSLSMLIDSVIEMENFSKELEKQNTMLIKKMVSETNKKVIGSVDVDYYKDMRKRNEELQKIYTEAKQEYFKKLNELNTELKKIERMKNDE